MKKIYCVVLLLVMVFIVGCGEEPEITFTIKDWEQYYSETYDEWGSVKVVYEMENVGSIEADYVLINIKIVCNNPCIAQTV